MKDPGSQHYFLNPLNAAVNSIHVIQVVRQRGHPLSPHQPPTIVGSHWVAISVTVIAKQFLYQEMCKLLWKSSKTQKYKNKYLFDTFSHWLFLTCHCSCLSRLCLPRLIKKTMELSFSYSYRPSTFRMRITLQITSSPYRSSKLTMGSI